MKEKIIALTVLIILSCCAYALDAGVEKKAAQYKAYDELLNGITPVEYKNQTYYWVEYTRNLMPSGGLLLDNKTEAVEDMETLKLFAEADMIRKNYPPSSVEQWMQFSNYFSSASQAFAKSSPAFSNDSGRIAGLLAYAAVYLNGSINYFSPEYAEKYLYYEEKAMDEMSAAYERTSSSDPNNPYLTEYRDSLKNIRSILQNNRDGIDKASNYTAEVMQERVAAEKNRPATDMYMIEAAVLLAVFVFFFIRRRKKQ
jgi:hypothetical protein